MELHIFFLQTSIALSKQKCPELGKSPLDSLSIEELKPRIKELEGLEKRYSDYVKHRFLEMERVKVLKVFFEVYDKKIMMDASSIQLLMLLDQIDQRAANLVYQLLSKLN